MRRRYWLTLREQAKSSCEQASAQSSPKLDSICTGKVLCSLVFVAPSVAFFNKSRKINHEPINKVSLIVIIIVDLFILFNVFVGLDDVSRWPMSPQIAYPCQYSWQEYRNSSISDKDYNRINEVLSVTNEPWQQSYLDAAEGQLGSVSNICLQYEQVEEAVDSPANRDIAQAINNVQAEINSFKDKNSTIRQQYDSTLLEEIAGQPREQSINNVEAAQARAEIEQNDRAIRTARNHPSNSQN